MAVEEPGVGGGEEADGDQFPGVEVLGDPGERRVVAVMHGVDGAVQEPHTMVGPVPHKVLEVEDDEGGQLLPHELPQRGRQLGQRGGRRPDPLSHGGGHDEEDVVPEGQVEGVPDERHRHLLVRLDLVLEVPLLVAAVDVHQHEGDALAEVADDGEDDGEEGRHEQVLIADALVPQRLKEPLLGDPHGRCGRAVQHAGRGGWWCAR